MVKIQVEAWARSGSNSAALRHTISMVSCARSSAGRMPAQTQEKAFQPRGEMVEQTARIGRGRAGWRWREELGTSPSPAERPSMKMIAGADDAAGRGAHRAMPHAAWHQEFLLATS